MVSDEGLKKYPILSDERFRGNDKQARQGWEKSYKLFEEWLSKKGYLENSRVLSKDIGYAVVEKIDNSQQWQEKFKNGTFIDEGNTKRLEITDKAKIETCLRNYKKPMYENEWKYVIGFIVQTREILNLESLMRLVHRIL